MPDQAQSEPTAIKKWLTPPLREPNFDRFATEDSEIPSELKSLRQRFSEDAAQSVVPELKALNDWQLNRARHAETRAATIQAAVSIAGSLVFAGASLALDKAKINEELLRWILIGLAALAILAFVAAALRAMQTHMTVQDWTFIDTYNVAGGQFSALTKSQLAGEYLSAAARNDRIVDWKLDRLKQAKWHFRNAIVILGVLAVAVLMTVVADSSPEKKPTQVELVGSHGGPDR